MLEPHRRAMLLEMLRPPEGYELSLAVGTTYSLDLLALLTAPVAFTLFDQEAVQTDPLGLLHTMRMYADRIRIFCQSGQIKIPREHQLLISHLENSVFEVTAPSDNGVFHPKVWALKYVAEDQQTLYRLLVLSRNLTFDRSWDTSLVLDGVLTDRVNRIGSNSPLGEFFLSLPELAKNPLPETVIEELDLIGDEIQKVEWELPDQFESIKFWALGLPNRRRRWPFKGRVDRMAVIAPFLSEGLLKELAPAGKDNILVSRTDTIENLTSDGFDRFNEIYAFNPGIASEEYTDQTEKPALEDVPDTGLHAKLFIGDMGYEARLWTGSANATRAAFYENVEFLVEFQGRKSQMGIKALFKDSDNGQVNFKDLLQSISGPPEDTSVNPLHDRLESQLRQARQVITKMGFHLRVDEIGQNDYNLNLESRSS
ncbi:MAG: phospholipase D family protein, partial [Anaerolineales bacterium]|nr:phospholipase D family protein [Anaerolineales bacterium]